MSELKIVQGPEVGKVFSLDRDKTTIGRLPHCEVVLDLAAVSREHAVVSRRNSRFLIEDLWSRNGTFVNGERLPAKTPRPLKNGDRVLVCDVAFDFLSEEPVDEAAEIPDDSRFSLLIDDNEDRHTTNVMSKLEVSTDYSSLRLSAKPEAKLAALIEISKNLSRTVAMDDIFPRLLDSLFKIFVQADRGFVVIKDSKGNLVPRSIKTRRDEDETVVRMSRTVISQVLEQREAVLSADAASDQRFDMAQSIADFKIRSMMAAPILDLDGQAVGAIQIDAMNQRGRFTAEDLEVLAGVASQTAIAIDNAQLHEQVWQQRVLERDLELAHRVQRGLLPREPPAVEGYHFFHYYKSANLVGGDYYDYVPLVDGRVAIIVGDVAGKGVSAALLMAKLSGEVRFSLASERDPARAVQAINRGFVRSDWEDRFVTFVVAVINPLEHSLVLVNAGHMPPLLRHSGGVVEAIGADQTGLPIGVVDDYQYESYQRELAPGDFITIFTDGFSEAMNSERELYGTSRIQQQVGSRAVSVAELGEHILTDVHEFVAGYPQSDDMCLACFGREER